MYKRHTIFIVKSSNFYRRINIQDATFFIAACFIVRIVEAVGNSSFLCASFSLVALKFPNTLSTVFALVEMAFGVGMILGPTAGGALFQAGGYTLPFAVLGGVLLLQVTSLRRCPSTTGNRS